jgi:RHS repeat-associated protein
LRQAEKGKNEEKYGTVGKHSRLNYGNPLGPLMLENPTTPSSGQKSSSQESSAFTSPQITLPKGGGAIRGIGEKFTANAVTGTGSLSVPIAVSPGRSGFDPQLNLSYDSGAGNGVFGIGWHLSLPAITRKTDKGLPRYRDEGADPFEVDVFILSGQEDLMPTLRSGTGDSWELDQLERDGYRLERYRPRIEGLFARIERWTRLEDGDVHWRSLSKDNILTLYGSSPESRISDPTEPAHIFSWLICQSYDDRGNAIFYEYVAEDASGVDLTRANERNRVRRANRYLKRVKYGNRRPLLVDIHQPGFREPLGLPVDSLAGGWMFELEFDYGEGHYREDPPDEHGRVFAEAGDTPTPSAAWPVRPDPFSTYRSGFEVRTYRLCQRALMFHHFPGELDGDRSLVRATEFAYREKPLGSFITTVIQSSFERGRDRRYRKSSLPPLGLNYTASPLENPHDHDFPVNEVAPASLANLPGGIDGSAYRWTDLNGEGISGVLTEQATGWFYKPNLGHGRFGRAELVAQKPSLAVLNRGQQQLLDVTGSGNLNLVELAPAVGGFYQRTVAGAWGMFRPFDSLPVRNWKDPNLKFVDVTGDGIADILVTEDVAFTWHPSWLEEGFGPAVRIPAPHDEEEGPRVVFADGAQSIYVADMSGDGLSDIVRIRNGEVCYWPNLGYGRFGAKVTMDNAPWFDEPDLFDERRVRLADTDGSGTTDILYLSPQGILVFLNLAGNGWSDARALKHFPALDDLTNISVVDFLGRGTACLLWSSALPGDSSRALRYVDLMAGQKPHLLVKVDDHLGSGTVIEYASSTEFFLADKTAGNPWITRLPFPVHVVKEVVTYDYVSRNRFVTSYTYHHGYFDGVEREFRGFGRVDQLDTEEFGSFAPDGRLLAGSNEAAASNVPPVLTKTWFHTGVFLGSGYVSRHLEHEYYREPGGGGRNRQALLEDTVLPDGLTAVEAREACRALKGSTLRQEIYALDGTEESSRPYTVAESNFTIRPLQPQGHNRYAVFFTHPRESLSYNYERKLHQVPHGQLADPRVTHHAVLAVDAFGNVTKSIAIGYARRPVFAVEPEQRIALFTLTENVFANQPAEADWYRVGVAIETRTFELTRSKRADDSAVYSFEELAALATTDEEIPYEARPNFARPQKRCIEHVRTLYRRDQLNGPLPLGEVESRALPFQSFKLAFTPGLANELYVQSGKLSAAEFARIADREARYVHTEGDDRWWIPSGQVFYSAEPGEPELEIAGEHFFIPRRFEDPFGNRAFVRYDAFDLLLVETEDAVGNIVRADYDYRVLAARQMTDPNGNRSQAAFDVLGMVAATAVMGKIEEPDGRPKGDTLEGFAPDLTPAQLEAFVADPRRQAVALLACATTRIVYDLDCFRRSRAAHPHDPDRWQPVFDATIARETHVSDLRPDEATKVQIRFSYSDGFGREIQKKIQADPGPLDLNDPKSPVVDPRWIASGWTIFNNRGKPVEQYEPFFDDTHRFRFGNRAGVTSTLFYDPVNRVVATLHPNHTYEKVVFDPWRQATWDVNDTVRLDPRTDPDVRSYVAAWFRDQPVHWCTWLQQRIDPLHPPADTPHLDPEQQAAVRTLPHANTPGTAHFDSLGRPFLTVADNGVNASGARQLYPTRVVMDIEGNHQEVHDALRRVVMRYRYNMLGTSLQQESMEAGERLTLNDATGKPIRHWDSRGHIFRTEYDHLRRLVRLRVTGAEPNHPDRELLVERTIYGDGAETGLSAWQIDAANLRGKTLRHFDNAGVVTTDLYDFKGNLRRNSRQVARDYRNIPDWSHLSPSALEREIFQSFTAYDALNRPIEMVAPHSNQPGTKLNTIRPAYNETSLLDRVEANLDGAGFATPFVTHIEYDAKGQRARIEYGNRAATTHTYDPLTFRLIHLHTKSQDRSYQDLHYTFDPAGNIVSIRDHAQQTLYFRNRCVEPSNDYTYDPLYRLIEAAGREHLGQAGGHPNAPRPPDPWDSFNTRLDQPGDGHAMGRYVERYLYDAVGNILALQHRGSNPANPGWTRDYSYHEPSQLDPARFNNRLSSTEIGRNRQHYRYDGSAGLHGDITAMPHLPVMRWDYRDQLQATATQVVHGGSTPETTCYVYDAAGQRVRKVTGRHAPPGCAPVRKNERIYLGIFEIYREYENDGQEITLQRDTLHLMDDQHRVAVLETRTHGFDDSPQQLIRYQLSNHLDSASLELDAAAQIISYEEYFPYGNTSYQAVRRQTEAPKRYRYTGKERDEETGFNYHGARYYIPWLGRWTACDPIAIEDGINIYAYVSGRPTIQHDMTGMARGPKVPKGEAQLYLSESKAFDFNVIATPKGRGFTRFHRNYAREITRFFGGPKRYDLSHRGKSHVQTKAGETVSAGIEERSANRARSASERGSGVRSGSKGADPTAGKASRVRQPKPPSIKEMYKKPAPLAPTPTEPTPAAPVEPLHPPPTTIAPASPPAPPAPNQNAPSGAAEAPAPAAAPSSGVEPTPAPTVEPPAAVKPAAPPKPVVTAPEGPGPSIATPVEEGAGKLKGVPGAIGEMLGPAVAGYFVGKDLAEGHYGEAALDATGLIPLVGDVVGLVRLIPFRVQQELENEKWHREQGLPFPRGIPY